MRSNHEIPTASVGSSQAPTDAVEISALRSTRQTSTYRRPFRVQTNGATSERHLAQERRLLSEIDRERMATRQASTELAKEQKARAAGAEAARAALLSAQQALHEEKAARREAESEGSRQAQALQLELATQRERTTAAEQRTADLASQLQRQQAQHEREIAQLRESQAATARALVGTGTSRSFCDPPC